MLKKIKDFLVGAKNLGFTLIELLVVISIIGLLSSVVMASLSSARSKSRDTRRMADLRQIQTALEMYYDANGGYPVNTNGAWGLSNTASSCGGYWSDLVTALSPYMQALPNDPLNQTSCPWTTPGNNDNYNYAYRNVSPVAGKYTDYELVARLEDVNNPNSCQNKCWKRHGVANNPSWCTTIVCGSSPQENRSLQIYSGR
jgi:type II secretion system protein G